MNTSESWWTILQVASADLDLLDSRDREKFHVVADDALSELDEAEVASIAWKLATRQIPSGIHSRRFLADSFVAAAVVSGLT
jgi:hypothetical protein